MPCRIPFLILTAFLLLSGCAGPKRPNITLTGATVGETSDHAATLDLALRLQNPNDEPLELLEFDYKVMVDGKAAFTGKRSAQMTLARQSTREIVLPAVVRFDEAGWAGAAPPASARVSVNGTLRYLAPGAIAQTLFDTGVSRPRASFSGESPLAASAPDGD